MATKEQIEQMYIDASNLTNTHPVAALELLGQARDAENDWAVDTETDDPIMPESYYMDVAEQIEFRAAATMAAWKYDLDMTVEDVAKTYGLQSGTVRRTIHLGNIHARKSGKNWLIRRSDAEARWGHGKLKPGPKPQAK